MKNVFKYFMICLTIYGMSSCFPKYTITGVPDTEVYDLDFGFNEHSFSDGDELKKIAIVCSNGKVKVSSHPWFDSFLLAYDKQTLKFYLFAREDKRKYHIDPIPNAPYANTGMRREDLRGSASTSLLSQRSQSSTSSSSSLLKKDYSKQIHGKYVGKGKLLKNRETIETYTNMTITMSSVDNNVVAVEILMDGNESVFAPLDCVIKKQGNNSYVLTPRDGSTNTSITIKEKNVIYSNSNVIIDGDVYDLQVVADAR